MDEVCNVSILDIDTKGDDISYIVRNTVAASSEMPANIFQNISFEIVDGTPTNFSFDVPETPIPSLPILSGNTTIGDDFINVTLQKMGVAFSSANAASIASYKVNLLADINTKIKELLSTQKDLIGETLFNFAKDTDRIMLSDANSGKLNMLLNDKIKFIIRLISGNGVSYNKSYEIVYTLQ